MSTDLDTVLFLDDETEVLNAIERELRGFVQVVKCSQPDQAFQALEKPSISVIVSDLNMPTLNGLEFLKKCRQKFPEKPRVLLTAFADLLSVEESINEAQVSRILTKPWKKSQLISCLEDLLRQVEIQQENQVLRTLSLTDALTGLSNYRYFWERLESEFSRARRFQRSLTLVMADIDDFKKINDTKGHPQGDAILKKVSQILQSEKRNSDTIARYGGEEFGIILPEVTASQAAEIAKRRLESLEKAQAPSLSFGVAELDATCKDAHELYARADKALYKAKRSGKACVAQWMND